MAFDLDLECAKAIERINRGIGQRWRHAKAETKRLADAARAEISARKRTIPPSDEEMLQLARRADRLLGGSYFTTLATRPDGPTDGGY